MWIVNYNVNHYLHKPHFMFMFSLRHYFACLLRFPMWSHPQCRRFQVKCCHNVNKTKPQVFAFRPCKDNVTHWQQDGTSPASIAHVDLRRVWILWIYVMFLHISVKRQQKVKAWMIISWLLTRSVEHIKKNSKREKLKNDYYFICRLHYYKSIVTWRQASMATY